MAVMGMDLGATNIVLALLQDKDIIASLSVPTMAEQGREAVIARMTEAARSLMAQGEAAGLRTLALGVAAPGIVDRQAQNIVYAPNLNWRNVPLPAILRRELDLPVWMGNDADLYALGEFVHGQGENRHDLICLTLGTGVGSGIIRAGEAQTAPGWSPELGHIIINPEGNRCNCGSRGCLETYASATGLRALLRSALERGEKSSLGPDSGVREMAEAAARADGLALDIFSQAGRALGLGIVNAFLITGIELIVLGGGVAGCWNLMEADAWRQIRASLKIINWRRIRIKKSSLGQEAPLRGAAALAREGYAKI
ncbi:MAG: ROK family protein [Desulfarculales bacterium]|nr:ROK family protein [Desulfarculales bacterium]